jgi:hypothetical protein
MTIVVENYIVLIEKNETLNDFSVYDFTCKILTTIEYLINEIRNYKTT